MKAGLVVLVFVALSSARHTNEQEGRPPHCTQLSKDSDLTGNYIFDYETVYIPDGQFHLYQELHCVNPPTVSKAITRVCDWAAAPQVYFTVDDVYVQVIRRDPTGKFNGSAVVETSQKCNHTISSGFAKKSNVTVIAM